MARQISLILVATLFLTLFTYHRSLFQLAPHILHHLLLDTPFSSLDPPSPLDIEALNQLTSIPYLGELFMEEKVRTLVQKRSWNNVLSECQNLDSMNFGMNKKLLPLRAVAECATYQFLKCEETIRIIKQQSPDLLRTIAPLSHLISALSKSKEEKADKSERTLIAEF